LKALLRTTGPDCCYLLLSQAGAAADGGAAVAVTPLSLSTPPTHVWLCLTLWMLHTKSG